jgi:uncharacterized protein YkwD
MPALPRQLFALTALCLSTLLVAFTLVPNAATSASPERAFAVPADTTHDPRPSLDVAKLERAIHRRVNAVRRQHGLPALTWADSLHALAQMHSQDMARRDFFGHTNPSGQGVEQRARRLGLSCRRVITDTSYVDTFGENLFTANRYHAYTDRSRGGEHIERIYEWKSPGAIPDEVVAGWMNSPPHRRNLLSRRYVTESISLAVRDDRYYVTQVLC